MKHFLLFILLLSLSSEGYCRDRTYLISLHGYELRDTEHISQFFISTWGVQFLSVCRIPSGWRIAAGSSATSDGILTGEGSQGITWFNNGNPAELRAFALVKIVGPVVWTEQQSEHGIIPATFSGHVKIETDDGPRTVSIDQENISLRPAIRCPN